jgi:ATP-dependent RNA helicase DeaD
VESFNELELSPELMRAISELGYTKPSQIQAQALPILLGEPTDFLGLAATGTCKTAAFGIPLLEKIDPSIRTVQAVILCPTRELALQVSGQIMLLGKHKNIRSVAIYGGASYGDQIRGLKMGAQVVVGTPGRVCDHIDKGTLRLDQLHTVILDEADEMISMGFKEDLEKILDATPRDQSHIWLFSATMSREVRHVADDYLRKPEMVQVNRTEMLPDTVEQLYYPTSEHNKPEVLCKLIDAADDFYGLVFCQTKALVADLTQYLTDRGYSVDCLHGDKDQTQRERTMKSFRDRKVNMLVCTDVASRGLDVKDITHVINYSIPRELDNYVHRIGRTARSGKSGFAMSLVTPSHRVLIGRIEKMTKSRMKEGRIPTRKEIGVKKVSKILSRFQAQENFARAVELLDTSWKDALAAMSGEEIAARFLSLTFPEVFGDAKPDTREERQPAVRPLTAPSGVVITSSRGNNAGYGNHPAREQVREHAPRSTVAPKITFKPKHEAAGSVVTPVAVKPKSVEVAFEVPGDELEMEAAIDALYEADSVLEESALPEEMSEEMPEMELTDLDEVVAKAASNPAPVGMLTLESVRLYGHEEAKPSKKAGAFKASAPKAAPVSFEEDDLYLPEKGGKSPKSYDKKFEKRFNKDEGKSFGAPKAKGEFKSKGEFKVAPRGEGAASEAAPTNQRSAWKASKFPEHKGGSPWKGKPRVHGAVRSEGYARPEKTGRSDGWVTRGPAPVAPRRPEFEATAKPRANDYGVDRPKPKRSKVDHKDKNSDKPRASSWDRPLTRGSR